MFIETARCFKAEDSCLCITVESSQNLDVMLVSRRPNLIRDLHRINHGLKTTKRKQSIESGDDARNYDVWHFVTHLTNRCLSSMQQLL